jgi:nanoRNase/pAp phosphatase (c-di-AMP/oligoRNAs hydrolase)
VEFFVPAMDWTPLKAVIEQNESFLISSHVRPDADALGSELGMRAILLAMGKKVSIVNASAPPANLQFMNPPGVILKLNDTVTKATIPQHDVVIIVDTSAWQQLGSMADVIQASPPCQLRQSERSGIKGCHISCDGRIDL